MNNLEQDIEEDVQRLENLQDVDVELDSSLIESRNNKELDPVPRPNEDVASPCHIIGIVLKANVFLEQQL